MKVTPEHLAILTKGIETMPPNATKRQRWDTLWLAIDVGKVEWSVINDYKDAHIDTALRAIAKEDL